MDILHVLELFFIVALGWIVFLQAAAAKNNKKHWDKTFADQRAVIKHYEKETEAEFNQVMALQAEIAQLTKEREEWAEYDRVRNDSRERLLAEIVALKKQVKTLSKKQTKKCK